MIAIFLISLPASKELPAFERRHSAAYRQPAAPVRGTLAQSRPGVTMTMDTLNLDHKRGVDDERRFFGDLHTSHWILRVSSNDRCST